MSASRGPPPCQHPDCTDVSIAATNWTYCGEHRDTDPALLPDAFDSHGAWRGVTGRAARLPSGAYPAPPQRADDGVDVISTVRPRRSPSTRAVVESAALAGAEASYADDVPDGVPVEFVDYPFTVDGTTEERVELVETAAKKYEPTYAVAPDLDGRIDADRAMYVAGRLSAYADVVIVPVHSRAVTPEEFAGLDGIRPGIPTASFGDDSGGGAGCPFMAWRFQRAECGVHVLGGSPRDILERAAYMPVASADTAAVTKAAMYGDVWTRSGWDERPDVGYYARITMSLNQLYSALTGREYRFPVVWRGDAPTAAAPITPTPGWNAT